MNCLLKQGKQLALAKSRHTLINGILGKLACDSVFEGSA